MIIMNQLDRQIDMAHKVFEAAFLNFLANGTTDNEQAYLSASKHYENLMNQKRQDNQTESRDEFDFIPSQSVFAF